MVDAGSIKFSSGRGMSEFKGDGEASPGIRALFHVLRRHKRALVLLVTEGGVAGKNPFSREGNHGGCLPR